MAYIRTYVRRSCVCALQLHVLHPEEVELGQKQMEVLLPVGWWLLLLPHSSLLSVDIPTYPCTHPSPQCNYFTLEALSEATGVVVLINMCIYVIIHDTLTQACPTMPCLSLVGALACRSIHSAVSMLHVCCLVTSNKMYVHAKRI